MPELTPDQEKYIERAIVEAQSQQVSPKDHRTIDRAAFQTGYPREVVAQVLNLRKKAT